ncbi:hypothetical protein JL721_5196 [Aureococcus anophagefferens]|nr:hypothetical protein JL721_5196 [Aureococcus anophagefferens]
MGTARPGWWLLAALSWRWCRAAGPVRGGTWEVLEGVEVVWEAPANRKQPLGLLVLFHRGGRSALSWWDASATCERCTGMPEEKAIVAAALAKGFAAVAVGCHDGKSSRWEPEDGPFVAHGLVALTGARRWKGVPLFALGVGCGAGFAATILPKALPPSMAVRGVHLQLMTDQAGLSTSSVTKAFKGGQGVIGAGWHGGAKATLAAPPAPNRAGQESEIPNFKGSFLGRFPLAPNVVICHMPRDDSVERAARSIKHAWAQTGATVLEQRAVPLPLTDAYFSDSVSGLSRAESAQIVAMLRVGGYLSGGGFLLVDPQRSAWRSVISAPIGRRGGFELGILRAIARDSLAPFKSPIAEELNRARARRPAVRQRDAGFFSSASRTKAP